MTTKYLKLCSSCKEIVNFEIMKLTEIDDD